MPLREDRIRSRRTAGEEGPVLLDRIRSSRRGMAVRLARGRLAFRIPGRMWFPEGPAYYIKSWWTDQPGSPSLSALELARPGGPGIRCRMLQQSRGRRAVPEWCSRLGKKDMPRNGHLEWKVAYAPGVLEARGYRGGAVIATERIETTGAPAQLVLTPDRTVINADGADVAVFTVSARDAQGRAVPTADNLVDLEVTGGRIIGVGDGDPGCHEPDKFTEAIALVTVEDWRGRIALPAQPPLRSRTRCSRSPCWATTRLRSPPPARSTIYQECSTCLRFPPGRWNCSCRRSAQEPPSG